MTMASFFDQFHQYGLLLIFVVTLCEYMNLPGFPAGVIMPATGVLIAQSALPLGLTLLLSITAGIGGSLILYAVCYWGGEPLLYRFFGKNEKFLSFVDRCNAYIEVQHGRGLAFCRIIPVLRTIVSIPAGLLRMPLKWFVGWSALGIAVWNTVLISFGYFFSEKLLSVL